MAPSRTDSLQALPPVERRTRRGIRLPIVAFWLTYVGLALALTILRRPDAVTHPQLYAEDGIWYGDAYNHGWLAALFLPHRGYLQVVARLTAALAQPFGLSWAPAIFNGVALLIQIAPALFLVSRRCDRLAPVAVRCGLGLVYLLLWAPELDVNLTNAQWHLPLLAFLMLVATPPQSVTGRLGDLVVLALTGLTGPFMPLLVPVAAVQAWRRRDRWTYAILALAVATAAAEIGCYLAAPKPARLPLGATPHLLVQILALHVFHLGLVNGAAGAEPFYLSRAWVPYLVTGVGLAAMLAATLRGPLPLRLFNIFGALVLGAGLASPLILPSGAQWPGLLLAPLNGGVRYFFIAELGWLSSLAWLLLCVLPGVVRHVARRPRAAAAAVGVATATAVGVFTVSTVLNWPYPPYEDTHFHEHVAEFEAAPPGSTVTIPLNPPGWSMVLDKR